MSLPTPLSQENMIDQVRYFLNETHMYPTVYSEEQITSCAKYCLSKWEKEEYTYRSYVPTGWVSAWTVLEYMKNS